MADPGAALVIVGHGSHLNPDSAVPVCSHADAIRERGRFAEVREAFWKEEPSIGEVLRILESETVYVVPLFMSEGYFTDRVIPRELRHGRHPLLDGNKTVEYTPPVGTHASMREVIVERAIATTGNARVGDGVGLALVGHGTERHETSGRSTRDHAAAIRELDRFDEVEALFMDEPPFVGDYLDHFESEEIVVVPFFVADGYHTREDLPEDLGLTKRSTDGFDVPTEVDGQRVWYAGAVGTDPRMVDVILDRAREAGAVLGRTAERVVNAPGTEPTSLADQIDALLAAASAGVDFDGLQVSRQGSGYAIAVPDERRSGLDPSEFRAFARTQTPFLTNWYFWTHVVGTVEAYPYAFLRWLERANEFGVRERYDRLRDGISSAWGQLWITVSLVDEQTRRYAVRHVDDREADRADLAVHHVPRAARALAKHDGTGRYRPLKSVPSLADGWIFPELTPAALLRTVDFFYPASIPNWYLDRRGELDVTHWREMADRQTGIYELVADLPADAVEAATAAFCVDSQCLKRRRWELDAEHDLEVPAGDEPIPCREPCSLFVAGARQWALMEQADEAWADESCDETEPSPGEDAREADFTHEANRYRLRYQRARREASDSECHSPDERDPGVS